LKAAAAAFNVTNGARVARWDVSNNTRHYYFSDHLGTLSVAANSSGVLENDSDYYPYGGERVILQNLANEHYKFTGKERDPESALDYFGARHYASTMGRFMTPDPLMASATVYDPQTWNRYAYALNNPLKYIDPTGMIEENAADCAKDKQCVTVKVNVIYDQKANLTDKQKGHFQQAVVAGGEGRIRRRTHSLGCELHSGRIR
jgi:RHS repeat-associated protein